MFISLFAISCDEFTEKNYCGTVVKTFRTDAGYKSMPEAHVVFHSDSLNKNIDVQVTWNTFANVEEGDPICFKLKGRDLKK